MHKFHLQLTRVYRVLVAYVEVFGISWEVMLNPQLPGKKNQLASVKWNKMDSSRF